MEDLELVEAGLVGIGSAFPKILFQFSGGSYMDDMRMLRVGCQAPQLGIQDRPVLCGAVVYLDFGLDSST